MWVHGNAKGFDLQADYCGRILGHPVLPIPPDYKKFKWQWAKACLTRNEEIVHRSDILIAAYDGRKTGGTLHAIRFAKRMGVQILYIPRRLLVPV
jgi:hypothetical protein